MRTLKKSLALVLAIVLVVGVCVFNAAAFTDDKAISHDEAVSVLTGIGVIKGRDTGAFDPTATLTRAEAATIITRLKGQEDLQAKSNFDDMHGHWAESYVAYCAAEGIVNGVGNNKFDPDAKLTGNQWGKMLLVAMGFDPAETGLNKGDTWEVAVAKLVKAKKLKVGVETLDMNAPISREETCVLAFNGLGQSVSGEKTYVASDGETFDTALDAMLYNYLTGKAITVDTPSDSLQANFPSLKEDPSYKDDFGRPGHQWTYGEGADAEAIYTEVDAPAYSYVAAKAETVTPAVLNTNLKLTSNKTKLTSIDEILMNGDAATAYVPGDLVEVYTDKLVAKKVVITHYELATITKVAELKKAELIEDDPSTMKINIELAGGAKIENIRDANFADYDYAEKDYVLVAVNAAKEVIASDVASTVTGKIDAKRGADFRINGAFYGVATKTIGTVTANIGTEATWALDGAGKLAANVVVGEAAANSTDYALIYNITEIKNETSGLTGDGYEDGATSYDYTVYAVLTDGTKLVARAYTDKNGKLVDMAKGEQATVVPYELKDGKFKVAKGEYNIEFKNNVTLDKKAAIDTGAFANASTVYISGAKVTKDGKSTFQVTTITGYKNAKLTNADIVYVVNPKNKSVLYVFTAAGISAVETEPEKAVAVLASATPMITKDEDDNDVYTYTVIIDGAEAELVAEAPITGVAEGQVFEYETVNDVLDPASVKAYTDADKVTVDYVSGNQVMAGGKEYSQAGAKVYAFDEDGNVTKGVLEAGQKVILIATSKNVITYAFIDYVPET